MLLDLKNISKAYRSPSADSAAEILRSVNLSVDVGQTVAITGPSGSGKSTLLNIVGALDQPDAGEVLVEGIDIAKLGADAAAAYRSRTVGFIFQLHHLLPQCTALENVLIPTLALAKRDASAQERARKLLASVGLENRLHHMPGQLSGGERQRVAVARALINEPKLLLADEPTGALDHEAAVRLLDLLTELNQSHAIAILLVTHAREHAARMQRIFELRDGALVTP